MSCSVDGTLLMWDLRTNTPQGVLTTGNAPKAAYDEQGLVFAIATDPGVMKLYDVRSYDKGPFDSFCVPEETEPISFMKFSADGEKQSSGRWFGL